MRALGRCAALLLACVLWSPPAGQADVVSLGASKDNTLYEHLAGALSNGAGQHFFAGRTNIVTDVVRRGVIAFDIAGSVPAGSTIDSVTLTLNMSRTITGDEVVELHRLLADWGEGVSDAPLGEGGGTASAPGDATWIHTFFATDSWATPGGDFSATISASGTIGLATGPYTWGPTPQMRDDVQGWLDDPSSNHGWLLQGNEAQLATAKRFDTKENLIAANRPVLTIKFTPPGTLGDLNCDSAFDGADIDPFFLALGFPDAYAIKFPDCDRALADMNGDDSVDGADIDAFFNCLGGEKCP